MAPLARLGDTRALALNTLNSVSSQEQELVASPESGLQVGGGGRLKTPLCSFASRCRFVFAVCFGTRQIIHGHGSIEH